MTICVIFSEYYSTYAIKYIIDVQCTIRNVLLGKKGKARVKLTRTGSRSSTTSKTHTSIHKLLFYAPTLYIHICNVHKVCVRGFYYVYYTPVKILY